MFPGLAAFLAVGVVPLMALWQLCRTGKMTSDGACRKYLIGWAIAIFIMGVMTLCNSNGYADKRVRDGIRQGAGTRENNNSR